MNAPRKLLLCVFILILCLPQSASAQTESDQASIAALINSYFAAFAQKDLSALVKLWSERSPDLAASIQEAQSTFAAQDYVFSNLAVSGVRIADAKAILNVSASVSITNIATKSVRQERFTRNFAVIKDRDLWKVWREAPASEDLSPFLEKGSEWKVSRDSIDQFANLLVASRGAEERKKLLADNQQMITADLRDALMRRLGPFQAVGKHDAVLDILEIVNLIAERIGDRTGIAVAQRGMGDAWSALGYGAEALKRYRNALAEFEAMGSRRDKAITLSSIAQVHFVEKNYAAAIASYEKALAEYEALKNQPGIANTLEDLASVSYEQESYDRALEYLERCLKLRESMGGKAEIAATLDTIGNVHFQQQDYGPAIFAYQKSLAAFEELNDADAIASAAGNIGSALYSNGDYDAALNYYQKALKLEDKLREKQVAGNLRLSMATVYSAQGNYTVALESLRGALTTFESLRNKNKIAGTLAEMGEVYFQIRNYSIALEHYQKSLKLWEELKSIADGSMTLYAIGNAYFQMGSFDLAIESYQKALAQFEALKHAPGVASMFASIAGVYYAQQKNDLALDFYRKALAAYEKLGDQARAAGVVERIGSVYYSKGEYASSLEWATRAVSMSEQIATLDTLWRARLTQGFALRATGETEQARQSIEQSIAAIVSLRGKLVRGEADAQRFYQNKNAAFASMMEMLLEQNKISEAFAYAERIKSHQLQDILQSPRARITTTMSAVEQSQEHGLENQVVQLKARIKRERERKQPDRTRLVELDARLQQTLQDYRAFQAKLYASHPRLKMLRGEAEALKLEQTAGSLVDADTALLEFIVADSKTYLFVLTRERQRRASAARTQAPAFALNAYIVNVSRSELIERIKKLRDVIEQRAAGVELLARETYDLLLAPAANQLGAKSRWLIVPDDALWQLPFSALQQTDNRYLIEDHTIAYGVSLTTLAEMSKPRAPVTGSRAVTAALFANPVISKQTAERLMLAGKDKVVRPDLSLDGESEVKSIERVIGRSVSRVYAGPQASEELLKREAVTFQMIHFAAPALLDDANPMYSHVMLSQSEENGSDDGLLEAWEMMKLDLRANLIVFSASEAAANRTSSGDSLAGLAWSLFVAGCPSSVVSRWRTDATASDAMMPEFYRGLRTLRGQRAFWAKAQALQKSALNLLKRTEYRQPLYWAGFSLVGDTR